MTCYLSRWSAAAGNWWWRAPPASSAWQFIAPALASAILLGTLATVAYNPMSANLRELSKRMEAELFGSAPRRRHSGCVGPSGSTRSTATAAL